MSIGFTCAEHLRRQLESLLNKHEVDLVLSGHVHSYARTCNVLGGKCTDMAQGGCAPSLPCMLASRAREAAD